jgi:uncharacterized protein YxeA
MKKIVPVLIAIVVIIFIVVLVKNMIQVKNSDQPAATSTSQSNSSTSRGTTTGSTTSPDAYYGNNNTTTVVNGNTNTYIPPTTTGGTTTGTTTTGATTSGTTGGTTTGGTTVGDPLDQKGLVNIDGELRTISHTLYPFSRSNVKTDVVALQDFLKAKGYLAVTAKSDGSYGNMTKAAVIKFQKANGISATGNVGPITMKKINTVVLEQKGLVN